MPLVKLLLIFLYSSQLFIATNASGTNISSDTLNVIIAKRTDQKINLDGAPDETFWQHAQKINLPYEFEPGNNAPAKVKTDAFFSYDDNNLYIGFICYETDISKLRAHITERDRCYQDDWFGILLDTFNEKKRAYEIFVNPQGIQMDAIWTPDYEDDSYEVIWQSAAVILPDRWTGEMVIPFKSLRFPKQENHEWSLHVIRNRPRSSQELISWQIIDRDNPVIFEQSGTLKGINHIESGKFLHLLPYAIAYQKGIRDDDENPASAFTNQQINGDAGIGLKYGVSSNLTLDLVLNPDFSQVESDAAQIDVNTTYALFYQEKRPFFQEGSETFQSHLGNSIIYTRTINNPLIATKLTGQFGKIKLGYISAYDRNSPYIIPLEEKSESMPSDTKSLTNILRLKYDLGSESYVGSIFTDREVENGMNRIGGLDARFVFLKNYYWDIQVIGSQTEEPNDSTLFNEQDLFSKNKHTAAFDGEKFYGVGFFNQIARKAKHVNFRLEYMDYSPSFRTANGFISRNNFRYLEWDMNFDFFPNKKLVDVYNISPEISVEYNHFNQLKERKYELYTFLKMKKQTEVSIGYSYRDKRFKNILFKNLRYFDFWIGSVPSSYLRIELFGSYNKEIYRTAIDPRKACANSYGFNLQLKPTSKFTISTLFEHYQLDELKKNDNIFNGYIMRGSLDYLFTKNLYIRLITQYNSFSENYQIDPLLRYRLTPYTIFYIGSTHDFKKYDEPYDFEYTGRQYFMKLQYLFQL